MEAFSREFDRRARERQGVTIDKEAAVLAEEHVLSDRVFSQS